jgi:type II secretion system protein C
MRNFMPYRGIKVLIAFLCVTLIAYALSSLLLFVLQSRLGTDKTPPPLPAAQVRRDRPSTLPVSHYKSIWEKNIFSTSDGIQNEAAEPVRLEDLSLTSLNCSLIGTMTDESGEGWAIIRDNDDSGQKMVTMGSDVKGARVVRIFKDKVVLNIHGKDELLLMDMEEGPVAASAASGGGGPSRGETMTYNVSRSLVQQSLDDLASVMSGVRVEPYFAGGRPEGFRVTRIQPGNLLTSMGFQNGDIIKSVNDHPIATAEDAMRLYNAMKDTPFFRVGIVRNNKAATLQIRVR